MALITPILYGIKAFDKSNQQTFTFFTSGGDQVVKNRLIIKNNLTGVVVYDQTQSTFKFEHILPSNTLTNGTQYKAQLSTFNINNNESSLSNTILFYCFTAPVLDINNLGGGVITASSYEFKSTYSQLENEELETFQYYLYDMNDELISASMVKYAESYALLNHQFSGFKDNTIYKIEIKGVTVNGMECSSEKQTFSVNYIQPNIPAVVGLENIPDQGCIKIQGNIINIEGTSNPSPPNYIDNNAVDLTQNGSWVNFDEGFSLEGDFTLKIWAKNLTNRQIFLTLFNKNDTNAYPKRIELYYFDNRIDVYKRVNNQVYYIYTDTIAEPNVDDVLFIWLRRVGNLLDVKLENLGQI